MASDYKSIASKIEFEGRAFHMAKRLPCGTVSVNTFSEGDIKTFFGRYKQSGSLSTDQGTEALNSFLQTKTI
jgi:acyl-CoA reductase-like NAD-dependent aldehyde dehydrogenase